MPTFTMTKSYDDGQVLTESMLDDMKNSSETFLNSTKIAADNIQTGGVETANLADGILSADAPGRLKVADGFVNAAKLASDSVTTGKIIDGALTADATGRAKVADGFVNAAKLASDAVTTVKILNSNVTGAKIETSVTLPGTPSFGGVGHYGVGNNASSDAALGVIRGTINSDGSVFNGSGYSASNTGTGTYDVSYTAGFGSTSIPQVLLTAESTNSSDGAIAYLYANSHTGFSIIIRQVGSTPVSRRFQFVAIGPQGFYP